MKSLKKEKEFSIQGWLDLGFLIILSRGLFACVSPGHVAGQF
jgi:hypothetical protein